MLEDKPVLIVQDNIYLALDLCAAVEELQGRVVGPVDSVADALSILDSVEVAAAVVDCELPEGNVTPLAAALCKMGIHPARGTLEHQVLDLPWCDALSDDLVTGTHHRTNRFIA